MNIKLLNSWIKDYLKTDATAKEFAEKMSLSSVSIERMQGYRDDKIFDIEITTNRPDLMSVIGLAREAGAVLPEAGIKAEFIKPKYKEITNTAKLGVDIINDSRLVNRICAVALEINLGKSPERIAERLETSDIRSINNAVDVTNYVMREVGHPMHVFDLDKLLLTGKMIIRKSREGERIETLDGKSYTLSGGDIVADNGKGEIIDLLGVMGTKNSAVSDETKRVLLFVDNNDPTRIRKTSMGLAIRTEAATLNEKGVDAELAKEAILRGVELLTEIADGKVISEFVDIYPNKQKPVTVTISEEKVNSIIGVDIPITKSANILKNLGFDITTEKNEIKAGVPSWRLNDVSIPEDLAEEVARVHGYSSLPSILPPNTSTRTYSQSQDIFYLERRLRNAMKYWGFTEVYTYPMVSENMLEVSTSEAVTIKNPLTEDHVYMRTTLVPSLLAVSSDNKGRDEIKAFELASVYHKRRGDLPDEKLMLGGIIKKPKVSFYEAKGVIEQMLEDFGITNYTFKPTKSGAIGADAYIGDEYLGEIEKLEENIVDFELSFDVLVKNANLKKTYTPVSKYPESIEDLRFEIDETIPYDKIVKTIEKQSDLVKSVSLLDVYKNKKTFRIIYQSSERNLTNEDLTGLREKVTTALKKSFKAEIA